MDKCNITLLFDLQIFMKGIIGVTLALLCQLAVSVSQQPVIGIYTQDYDNYSTYIASSYVKYIEMSGAQVVPLYYTYSETELILTLNQINGVLIPGGSQIIDINNTITQNANAILKYSIDQYEKGIMFPVWGTCGGHGMLAYLTSNFNPNTRQKIDKALGIMNTLKIVKPDARMLKNIPSQVFDDASRSPGIAYFFQHWAVYTETYQSDSLLNSFWDIVSTSVSPDGKQYVTAWESKKYPIFSVQFHPQKSNFEWEIDSNHSQSAISLSQYLSNNFVQIARNNPNRFADGRHLFESLIYNFKGVVPDPSDEDYNMFTELFIFGEHPR